MNPQELLSVSDAARALEVNDSRVRALLASGQLDGIKLGGRWLVPSRAVWERSRAPRERGRPFVPANAWAVLSLASGQRPEWVSRDEQRRLSRLLEFRGFEGLIPRLRERAEVRRFYAHPGILRELVDSPEVIRAGVSAARRYRLRLVPGDEVDAYVSENDLPRLVKRMALEPREEANVRLRVIAKGLWPFKGNVAPLAAVAVDLAELPDARAKRIGRSEIHDIAGRACWREAVEEAA
jgi:excisionase family DNA binding protein